MRTFLVSLLLALGMFTFSEERDFNTPEAVLEKLYPGAVVEVKNLVLSKEQQKEIENLAKAPLSSRLISIYVVKKEGRVIAYGYVDTHRVRTHTESVLFVINPEGKIELIEVLSFNEPLEYMADENWLALFKGKSLDGNASRIRKSIPNMTGATLTARAIKKAASRALAIWKVLFGGGS